MTLGESIEFLVVGSGLTGAVIARELTDAGKRVLVMERRPHIAGNVHDHTHPSGIRVHTFGPHYFRTNSDALWEYVNRFTAFYKYEPALKSLVDGALENWPIAQSYINRTVGADWQPSFTGTPTNFEEAALSLMPAQIYERFVKGYSEKQWGVPAKTLSADLVKRFDVRADDEPRLMRHSYQGIPENGYTAFVAAMLRDIPVLLNCDYLRWRHLSAPSVKTIFTGPIDEYFDYDLGRLEYRGQRREEEYLPEVDWVQPCGQVNNPDPTNGEYIRTLEWKHMMHPKFARQIHGTLLTREFPITPTNPTEYEYPFPDTRNATLYKRYQERAASLKKVLFCGRLGEYRYYDMDQAIGRALVLAKRLLTEPTP